VGPSPPLTLTLATDPKMDGGFTCSFSRRAVTQLAGSLPSLAAPFPVPPASRLLVPLQPSFQLLLVTTNLWPWTDQTSTQNKSLFEVDSVTFPAQPLQVEVLPRGTLTLPAPEPRAVSHSLHVL
uniref:Uncharacterized protein n=1 Tax=Equus caballus TaxID=9796 RepID=A0A9L0S3E3_HORSE